MVFTFREETQHKSVAAPHKSPHFYHQHHNHYYNGAHACFGARQMFICHVVGHQMTPGSALVKLTFPRVSANGTNRTKKHSADIIKRSEHALR